MLDHEQRGNVLNVFHIARKPMAKARGFTLIELMIVVVIVALATTIGMPSYRTWVQNTQIYNATESTMNGLQKAKAEAVKQNANIQFVLAANPPWIIQVAGGAEIERATTEGAKNVTAKGWTVDPATGLATTTQATTVTFSNLGGVVANAANLGEIDFTSSTQTSSRNLRIMIGVGGNVRMCDPNLTAGSSPRAC
jgi:type IV fimbrial biogenesis protein FimT